MQELPDKIADADKLNGEIFKDLNRAWNDASRPAETPAFVFPPLGAGKTETLKALARQLGLPLTEIDLKEMLGAPPGYQGYKPTPEEDAALKKSLAEMTSDLDLAVSIRNGEELAATCHTGVTAPAARMKPLRYKAGFILC